MKKKYFFSYAGEILRINLSNKKILRIPTDNYAKQWIGGPGIAIKIMYDEVKPWVTPYDPMNKIIFGSGALQGTFAPGANKINVSSLSPITGGWGSGCSDSFVGANLKWAGYDSLIIEGKAREPVYIWIDNDQIEIRDASFLWGRTTWETLDILRERLKDQNLHILSIGPAGENIVRGACIIQDKSRAVGRCGLGAVMGSKNLKAVVVKGSKSLKIAHPSEFFHYVSKITNRINQAKSTESFKNYGTLQLLNKKQEHCGIQYKNFQKCTLPTELLTRLDPKKIVDKYKFGKKSFPGCAIGGCGKGLKLTEGPYSGLITDSPQWEAFGSIQARLAVLEPTFMVKANTLCNQLGLDVDMVGGSIGWAMECYQRNLIHKKEVDNMDLSWGNEKSIIELIKKIAFREGFGDILAEGSKKAAEILGNDSEYYALNIKGQDLYETCRGANGWCLGAATSTRGGGHTTGSIVCEFWPDSILSKAQALYEADVNLNKPLEYKGKAHLVYFMEILHRINNCLGICHYNTIWWDIDYMNLVDLSKLYSLATGWDIDIMSLKNKALKQINLEKAFNLLHTNFSRKDDYPAAREMNEPIPEGNLSGWKIDKTKYDKMLDDYYDIHGWDKKTSFPKRETLNKFGLKSVADDLQAIGKLQE